MFQTIFRLIKHTAIYGAGNVLTRLIWFVLLPVMTRILSPEQFGVQVLFYILIAIMMEIVRLGQDVALLRYFIPEKDAERRRTIFSTIFWASLLVTSIISAVIWLGAEHWVRVIVTMPEPYPDWMVITLKLCAVIIWLDNMAAFPLIVMRGENRPGWFLFAKLTGVVVQAGITAWFLISLDRGVQGIFEGNVIASAVVLIICLPLVFARLKIAFDRAILRRCLGFGLPNVPNVLFVLIIELSDRKILELFRTAWEVGIYSVGYKLGMFLAIFAMGFRLAWQPFFMQVSGEAKARRIYARVLTYYIAVAAWLFLVLTAFIEPLVEWDIPGIGHLIDPKYWDGIGVFPIVSLAHIFNGMFAVFVVGIYLKDRMRALPVITAAAAVLNLGGNLLLVPRYGIWASAWLTVAAYALMAGLLFGYVQRIYPVPWEWRRVLHLALVAAVVYAAGAVGRQMEMSWIGYAGSILYPLFLLATGLATPSERNRMGIHWKPLADQLNDMDRK